MPQHFFSMDDNLMCEMGWRTHLIQRKARCEGPHAPLMRGEAVVRIKYLKVSPRDNLRRTMRFTWFENFSVDVKEDRHMPEQSRKEIIVKDTWACLSSSR